MTSGRNGSGFQFRPAGHFKITEQSNMNEDNDYETGKQHERIRIIDFV